LVGRRRSVRPTAAPAEFGAILDDLEQVASRLTKRYGHERLTDACQRALALGSPSYRTVESILKTGQDRLPLSNTRPLPPARFEHENVRGAAYYRS
jgi:hypothetical protein